MKTYVTAKEIIEKRLENDRIIGSLSVLEYKKNNRLVDKNFKLFKLLEADLDLARAVYGVLLTRDNSVTKLNAATECLSLGIYIDEAVRVLAEMAVMADNDMRCFNAKMTLEDWREQGYLKMYPEQEIRKPPDE